MGENVKMVESLLSSHGCLIADHHCDDLEAYAADVNGSEGVFFTTSFQYGSNYPFSIDANQTFVGISHTQRKFYWGKDSWSEIDNVAVEEQKKASPLSVALGIGNEKIVALLKKKGATSHSDNAAIPITYNWNLTSA